MVIFGLPSLVLAIKIISRPHIHTIFNTSLACLFSVRAVFGPAAIYFTISVLQNFGEKGEQMEKSCARLVEMRHIVDESSKIITSNILFRFFFIVYGDRGLVKNGFLDTRLFRCLFILVTLALSASSFLSFRLSVGRDPTYPANTVSGRVCLGLRPIMLGKV